MNEFVVEYPIPENGAGIIKVYKQSVPAMRFIGKKYDRPGFDHWVEWFDNGWFEIIENAAGGANAIHSLYEDGDAYIGMLRFKDGEPIQYWIGIFVPVGSPVPDGFLSMDISASNLGVNWIYGSERDIFGKDYECYMKLTESGMQIQADKDGAIWSFERRGCPRMTTPDDKGNYILDYCYFVK